MAFQFITPAEQVNHPKLWKDFSLDSVRSARLEITGLGLYRAFLNGKRVGRDYLTPGFNDYDAYLRYQTYDVTALMQKENHLEVWLGNGWYKGRFGFGAQQYDRWGSKYFLAARLIITDQAGQETTIETDESWLAARSPILDSSIYDGETRDDNQAAGESIPCMLADVPYQPEAQFSPPIRVVEEKKPALLITPKNEQVLDFGQNLAGTLRIRTHLKKGEKMHIQTGEVLQQGCFYRDNLRSAKSEYIYISDGTEKEIEPLYTFYGFRYARIEGVEKVNPEDFTALVLCSDLKETLQAETGHALLNQLMKNTFWGQRSNFLDVPTDCPQRDERLGWTGDTQVFANTACYQMDCKDFYRKFMRDLREDQVRYYDGQLPMVSPSLRKSLGAGGAVWSDVGTILPWNVYMNYGDRALLLENYPMMRDYAEALIREDEKLGGTHLKFETRTYGDWLSMDGLTEQYTWGGTLPAYIQGVYYYHSLCLTLQAAKELGKTEDARRYAALSEEIRQALLDEYVSPGGNLTIDTQTGYILALRYGIYRSREKMIDGLRYRLRRDFYRIKGGFTGAPLMLPVLLDCGLEDDAYRVLLTEEFPGWLHCIKLGATTIWERWNSLNPDGSISGTGMNSLNHYAYGSVCEAIYSRIMGLRCVSPGWKKARIAPQISGRLGHASIRYESAAGVWEVSWQLNEDGSADLHLSVPQGAEAQVCLPSHPDELQETVGAGSHDYHWRTTRDYLHPFSMDSLLMDVLAHPEGRKLLEEMNPAFCQEAEGAGREMLVNSLEELNWQILSVLPEAEREAARRKLEKGLRAIHA